MTKEYPWGKGTPKWIYDDTANDSDKSYTVPAGKVWELLSVYIYILTSATVGSRTLSCVMTDGTNNIQFLPVTGAIATGQRGTYKFWYGGPTTGTTAADCPTPTGISPNTTKYGPMPRAILPAGYVIRCYDTAAIDAGADDMTVVLHYVEYDA